MLAWTINHFDDVDYPPYFVGRGRSRRHYRYQVPLRMVGQAEGVRREGCILTPCPSHAKICTQGGNGTLVIINSYLFRGDVMPVAPVVKQVILVPAIGQLREFESPRVYIRINS